jgi:hypothetical protein
VSDKPSYLKAMLTSQTNLYAGLGTFAAAALISMPFGFGVGLLPVLLFLAGEGIASLYVPSSITFRASVDAKHRLQERENAREHLLQEIRQRTPDLGWDANPTSNDGSPVDYGRHNKFSASPAYSSYRTAYQRMLERIQSLKVLANDRRTQLSTGDIERLEEATLDFLSLWLGLLVMDDRASAVNLSDVQQRMDDIDQQLKTAPDGPQRRQFAQARAEYASLLQRHDAMTSKRQSMEATMLAMPDQIEEIYQMIMAAPFSSGMSSKLGESLSRLRLEDELEQELNDDLHGTVAVLPYREPEGDKTPAAQKQAVSTTH